MVEKLIAYQTADAKLREIEKTLGASEDRKKAVSAKKYLEGVEESVNKLDMRSAELVAAFEKANQKQIKLKEQETELMSALENLEDEKGADYLNKKAEELISRIKALENETSKILEEMQEIVKEYSSIKVKTKKAQTQYAESAQKYNELKESVKAEKEAVEKELASLAKDVDPELLKRYLNKRADKMYPIVYEIRGNVCGACNMELHVAALDKLKKGGVIDCDQCGRMLYQKQK